MSTAYFADISVDIRPIRGLEHHHPVSLLFNRLGVKHDNKS